jgi:hypothetical protein
MTLNASGSNAIIAASPLRASSSPPGTPTRRATANASPLASPSRAGAQEIRDEIAFSDVRSTTPSDDGSSSETESASSSTSSSNTSSSTDSSRRHRHHNNEELRGSSSNKLSRSKGRVFASQLVFGAPELAGVPNLSADDGSTSPLPSPEPGSLLSSSAGSALRSSSSAKQLFRSRRGSSPRGDASLAVAAAASAASAALCQACGVGRVAARVVQQKSEDQQQQQQQEASVQLLCRACVDSQATAVFNDAQWSYERLEGGKLLVHGATLEKLVEQLAVADAIPDWDFIEDFLITFRYFTTPADLLDRLAARYAYELPDSLAADERETALKWKGPVQLRVINIFKKWLEAHFYDFEPVETSPLTRQLHAFADTVAKNNERWASALRDEALQQRRLRLVERATGQTRLAASDPLETIAYAMKQPATELVCEQRGKGMKKAELCFAGAAGVAWLCANVADCATPADAIAIGERLVAAKLAAPCTSNAALTPYAFINDATALYQFMPLPNDPLTLVYPKPLWTPAIAGKPPGIADVLPEELARQLTLLASAIYMRITTNELKSQAWAKADAKQLAPNLTALIAHFNRTSYFVASNLVTVPDAPTRALVLKRFVQLADAFFELRNYDGVFAVYLGLNIASVSRLKKTWALLSDKQTAVWERISNFCLHEHNHRNYRAALKSAKPPTLPYMAIYTADLTHIEDGNDDRTARGMINFEKMRMISSVWRDIARFQSLRFAYCYRPIAEVQTWFTETPLLTDEELYKFSLVAEPRATSNSPMLDSRPRAGSLTKMFGSLRKSSSAQNLRFDSSDMSGNPSNSSTTTSGSPILGSPGK